MISRCFYARGSIVNLLKEAFDINVKPCTDEEWAKRITIICGVLKQLQLLRKVPEDKESTTYLIRSEFTKENYQRQCQMI